jgi:hypothetical protein
MKLLTILLSTIVAVVMASTGLALDYKNLEPFKAPLIHHRLRLLPPSRLIWNRNSDYPFRMIKVIV